jgi:hypothetical protein
VAGRLPSPGAPFVELGVYAHDRPDEKLFTDVLDFLVRRGGTSNGRARAHLVADPDDPFEGPTDVAQVEVPLDDLSTVAMRGSEHRIVAVEVAGVLRYDRGHCVVVTYLRVDRVTAPGDHHPVALWATGELFSGPVQRSTMRAGTELRDLFRSMVEDVRPSYGAITVDWPLCSPQEIAADPKLAGDYGDVFVGRDYVGEQMLAETQAATSGQESELTPLGLFVFSSPALGVPAGDRTAVGSAFVRAIARGRRGR